MPFLRHARDKRGYETTFVMHSFRPGAGQASGRTRLLYMFRSPSNRKVGRNLLDPEVMEALEHTHPDLTFDWVSLLKTPALTAPDPERTDRDRERDRDRGRQRRDERRERQDERREKREAGKGSREAGGDAGRQQRDDGRAQREGRDRSSDARRDGAAAAQPAVILEDDSLLGRTLGAVEAARLRAAYSEITQRIVRRARTPEERDRLTERAARLNPDDWSDADAVSAGNALFGPELEAIRQELPRRRRGRRGGRSRDRDEVPQTGTSPIIEGNEHHEMEASADSDDPGHGDGLGAATDADPAAGDPDPDAGTDRGEVHERD